MAVLEIFRELMAHPGQMLTRSGSPGRFFHRALDSLNNEFADDTNAIREAHFQEHGNDIETARHRVVWNC